MPVQTIDLTAPVQAERKKRADEARSAFDDCVAWVQDPAQKLALQDAERELMERLLALGCALLALWMACKLPTAAAATMTHGPASYRYAGFVEDIVRTRFGEIWSPRAVYRRIHGKGPATIAPQDRVIGLAAGRMTLGVHFLAGFLAARMPFDGVIEVMSRFVGYVPSKRAILGIIDRLGPAAVDLMEHMPAPEGDGEILVIQRDDKGAGMISKKEHAKRCKPHKKGRGRNSRAGRRRHRHESPRLRRPKGKKSKNARMAKVFVIYTLRRMPDGTLEGPINKRVIATFKSSRHAFTVALRHALLRGYGKKRSYFLADGAHSIWKLQQEFFPQSTPCVDWYHVCEYLWLAGGTVYREGSPDLATWVHARKQELRGGKLALMLIAMQALRQRIGKSGPGTKGRRERLRRAIGYIEKHRTRLRYAELAKADMDIATGAVEGAVNHVIGLRLDGSMMRWTLARADYMAALRCLLVNGMWDDFERAASEAHSRRRDPVVERVTPAQPQEPYDAVRKAA